MWKIVMYLAKKWPEMVGNWPNAKVVSFLSRQSLLYLVKITFSFWNKKMATSSPSIYRDLHAVCNENVPTYVGRWVVLKSLKTPLRKIKMVPYIIHFIFRNCYISTIFRFFFGCAMVWKWQHSIVIFSLRSKFPHSLRKWHILNKIQAEECSSCAG